MKKRKDIKAFRSVTSVILCILLLLGAFALSSCGNLIEPIDPADQPAEGQPAEGQGEPAEGEPAEGQPAEGAPSENGETEERRSVVRVKKGILEGGQLTEENLELVEVPVSGIPEGAITTFDAIVGKYAALNIVMGEYLFDRMLNDDPPPEKEIDTTYITVSDSIAVAGGRDVTADLQALIDKNPGRAIYFSDGEYNISSTIYISADKEKSVSFRLSNYAVIKATADWSGEGAMISIGGKDESAIGDVAAISIMGGTIDGAGKAKVGLAVENAASPFISNLTVKNTDTSIWIKDKVDSVNIEGLTVNGSGAAGSIGILNESSRGVMSTVNMANVAMGIKNSGNHNEFRNISILAKGGWDSSCGFYELGNKNVFGLCTAENFAVGYRIADKCESVFEGCNAYWSGADVTSQTAFLADGEFNSLIVGCQARFFDASSANAYLKYGSIGSGIIKAPIFDEAICDDQSYKNALSGSVIAIK